MSSCLQGQHAWFDRLIMGHLVCQGCGQVADCLQCLRNAGRDIQGLPPLFCTVHQQQGATAPRSWRDVSARLIALARQLPADVWADHPSPLLRWRVASFLLDGCLIEVVQEVPGDYWRLIVSPAVGDVVSSQVYPAPRDAIAPYFHAAGPAGACRVVVAQPGRWYGAVMAATYRLVTV